MNIITRRALALSLLGAGCNIDRAALAEKTREAPNWSLNDLEVYKRKGIHAKYNTTVIKQPPFYNGKLPLDYEDAQIPRMGIMFNTVHLFHRFKEHTNYFVYNSLRQIEGVIAVNNANVQRAEARVTPQNSAQGMQFQMEEFHYGTNNLRFYANSIVDINTGFKTQELETHGSKEKDYFFLLPRPF